MNQLKVDVLLLQETHLTCTREVRDFEGKVPVTGFYSFGERSARGVATLVSPTFRGSVGKYRHDDEGRLLTVDVVHKGKVLRIANVYAPVDCRERNLFFRNLDFYLQGRRELVLAGDFNCVLDQAKDSLGGTQKHQPWKAKGLRQLVTSCSLVDAWTHLHGNVPGYTFSAQGRSVRLDRFYVTGALVGALQDCEVMPVGSAAAYVTDHQAVVLEMELAPGVGRQATLWRLNTRLLQDEEVVKHVRTFIKKTLETKQLDLCWWDEFTTEITEVFKAWGRRRAAERRQEVAVLQWGMRNLRRLGLDTPAKIEAYTELQTEFQQLLMSRVSEQGPISSCRSSCRPPPRVSLAAKLKSEPQAITELNGASGTLLTSQQEVEEECRRYYKCLYTERPVDETLWKKLCDPLPRLTNRQAEGLDVAVTRKECWEALSSLAKGKAPGPDGLPVEFYLKFWDLLADPLVKIYQMSIEEGCLPQSMRQGVLKLLCKDNTRRRDLAAWRPITLLNASYKILAKVLQTRLSSVMHDLVSPQQVFLPVRTRLYRMGYSRTDRCPECGSLENHKHVFYDCLNAAALWRKVAGLYGLPRVTYDTVRFLDPMPVPQRKAPGFGLLVLEVVFQLWTARNKAIYGGNKTALRQLVFETRNALFARITEDLATLSQSEFRTRWRNHHDLFMVKGTTHVRVMF
ncbi:hypothetical protein ISCGN_030625 [Ixodes scapularis]